MINSDAVKNLHEKSKTKCFIGLCPNFKSRYQLSRRAKKDANVVDELLREGVFDEVSYRDIPQPTAFAASKDFEAFESREQMFHEIMEAVKDPNISIIGVHGMPGVSKTMLVREVVAQVKEDKLLFNSVVFADVNHTPDIQKIQDQIAEMLGLKLEEKSTTERASRLFERLKEKKFLVVLDDIWAGLDLKDVGIPFEDDERQGCTILLTSRDANVLKKDMDAKSTFAIGVLKQEEAWNLFKNMAGDGVEAPDLRPIATEVAIKCGGLPLAIKALGRSLRDEPRFVWEDVLQRLSNPSSTDFRGVPPEVYLAIELSYDRLNSEEHKQTFLLCSLMGHNASIKDLLKYATGLGLFHGVSTVKATQNRLLTVVSHLKAVCLLIDSHTNQRFDMHDLICDVALSIACKFNCVFALRRWDVLIDWPGEETMKECDKVSLHGRISQLPDKLACPKLAFLCISNKDLSLKVSTSFFQEMKILKVLSLTKMLFQTLPSSISLLANLQTLCLDQCVLDLGDISLIGELKNLKILSLLGSEIETLPKEIGQLIELKLFDLSRSKLKRIPSGIFCRLCKLEELYMANSFVQWEAEGNPSEQSNASLAELMAMPRLTVLDVHILSAQIIPRDFSFENMERYNIFIGEAWDWVSETEYSRTLKLKLQTSFGSLHYGINVLMKKVENLYLDEMKGLEILLHGSEARSRFLQLKNLHIQNGAMIQYILNDPQIEFPQLHSLTLEGLPKLISFCARTSASPQEMALFNQEIVIPKLEKLKLSAIGIERIWVPRGFCSTQTLTSIIMKGCPNLKHVLSYSTLEYMQQLRRLEIIECNCLSVIISDEEIIREVNGNKPPISFPRLNSLKLKGLQTLIGFCHEDYTIEFPVLKILEIENCPELKGFKHNRDISTDGVLFDENVVCPNLEKISISNLRNVKRVWHNQLHEDSFSKLKELKAEYCDGLLMIFPPFPHRVFEGLELLSVTDCASLEEVFHIEEGCRMNTQLKKINLVRLPNLKHVWNKDPNGNILFGNLRTIYVYECRSLKALFPFSIARDLHQLERLTVDSCGVEEIVSKKIEGSDEHETRFEFNKLSILEFSNLRKLVCFYPEIHSIEWPVLKWPRVDTCDKLIIFGKEESQSQPSPLFLIEKIIPQLEEIRFSSNDIAMINDGRLPKDLSFGHIKQLQINRYHSESAVFPFSFL